MANISPQPCAACVTAGQAILTLSSSIQDSKTALDAAEKAMKSISVPLPNDVAVALGYRSVDLSGVPEVFRKYCQLNGLQILKAQPGIVHARAVYNHNKSSSPDAQITGVPTVLPSANGPSLDPSVLQSFNTTNIGTVVKAEDETSSISSVVTSLLSGDSTNGEREYSIDPAAMLAMDELLATPLAASTPIQIDTSVRMSSDHITSDDRWYVVVVGREPGVIQGHKNRLSNVEGVPKADSYRVPSEQEGWQEFLKRLDKGDVVQVQMIRQERVLSAADFAPQ